MQKKMIGLCLKYEANNYGSKLQALATLSLFEELGYECKVIHYMKKGLSFKIKSLSKLFNLAFLQDKKEYIKRKLIYKKYPYIKECVQKRTTVFNNYDKEYFDKYEIVGNTFSDIQKLACRFDAVVSCSDQLWSPAGLSTNFYNLMFVPNQIKKVSFASSFGVSSIPISQIKKTKEYLQRIDFISCRENSGAKIVKEMTGKDVPVLMDPVFAYDKEEWKRLVKEESVYDFPYVLSYLLGNNAWHRKEVEKFAKANGLKIVAIKFLDCSLPSDADFGDYAPFDVDPNKFLNIIRGAKYVVTDSFHGTAFSIICQKNFAVFSRYSNSSKSSKNTRIESVCNNLQLSDRWVDESNTLEEVFNTTIKWSEVQGALNGYKHKMREFLIKALS